MGILDRFTSIVKANINELLDKAEDPEKMVDQYLREMTESLAEVREATAGVMAEEKRCKKLLDENREETEKYEELARKALAAGNEADARVFLAKKQELAGRAEGLMVAYEGAKANADKMRQMHDKLVADIEELNARKATIKAKAAVAKTQSKVNEMTSAGDRAEGARRLSTAWRPRPTRCSTAPMPWPSCPRSRPIPPRSSRRSTPPPAPKPPSTTTWPA